MSVSPISLNLVIYRKTSVVLSLEISYNGTTPDIRNDTVTFYLFDKETKQQVLSKAADVTTYGQQGIALLTLTPTDTAITAQTYIAELVWQRQNGEIHLPVQETVQVKERYSAT